MVDFDSKNHIYTNPLTKEKYTSVTTYIGKFKPPFKKDEIAARVAKKQGIPVQVVLDTWNEINKKACDYGTAVHNIMEKWLLDNTLQITSNEKELYIDPIAKIWKPKFNKIQPEKRLWLNEYKIAGTTDVYEDNGKYFNLYDFKTNKEFNFKSKYNEWMLDPISHMPICEYTTYALQLSFYAYMQEQLSGQKVGELVKFHYNRQTKQWSKYNTPYLKYEVLKLLNHHLNTVNE